MAWVIGIRQVNEMLVENEAQERTGALNRRRERVCTDLRGEAMARTVGRRVHVLPEHRGAGACGTDTRSTVPARSALTWTLLMLWPHLARYYATRNPKPYMKMGPKSGGGNGKERLW